MYQLLVLLAESRNSPQHMRSFPDAKGREDYAKSAAVYWYHYVEWEDWHQWARGGAWEATQELGKADVVPDPPEITEEDRW